MPFADSGGTRIYYQDEGEGEPTLLCLPGWCTNQTLYTPLAERLSAERRVLAMDWRGHGRSDSPDWDFGFAQLADDAQAVIEDSGVRSVIPVAQGQGPWVDIELRRRLGERVPKMVAVSWPTVTTEGNPFAPLFLSVMKGWQDKTRWREASEQALTM
jgi:pimeloyl-ACP methyl ester carboxylesterase